ncbi:hypothetical protein WMF20_45950 [Sorangium sp. So ce834]|uniref:hypothetical protein n=1 Tax=Sorangium sp. So ce834 TaxID=3133321 RepID=UPI003F639A52
MADEGEGSVAATSGLARRLCALALLAVSGGLLASACADNESSLFVRMRMARTGDCTVTCSPDEPFWTEDAVDAAYSGSHSATLLVGNQIVQRGDPDVLRTETSRVHLYEAEVRVDDIEGNAVTEGYVVPITGMVDPGTGSDAGYNCAEVLLLDGATMDSLRRRAATLGRDVQVVATVVVRGRTLGGQEVETSEWSYPIRVCFACSRCVDVSPDTCCSSSASEACEDNDEVEATCPGQRGPQDCRNLGRTCADYINSFGL